MFRPWLWLKFGWVGGKRFFLKRLSFTHPNFVSPPLNVQESLALSLDCGRQERVNRIVITPVHLKKAFRVLGLSCRRFHSCQFRGNSLTRMYRVAGLKCLTHIYTGFHTSRDKGSLMKLLPLDLRFPKSKLKMLNFEAWFGGQKLDQMAIHLASPAVDFAAQVHSLGW